MFLWMFKAFSIHFYKCLVAPVFFLQSLPIYCSLLSEAIVRFQERENRFRPPLTSHGRSSRFDLLRQDDGWKFSSLHPPYSSLSPDGARSQTVLVVRIWCHLPRCHSGLDLLAVSTLHGRNRLEASLFPRTATSALVLRHIERSNLGTLAYVYNIGQPLSSISKNLPSSGHCFEGFDIFQRNYHDHR